MIHRSNTVFAKVFKKENEKLHIVIVDNDIYENNWNSCVHADCVPIVIMQLLGEYGQKRTELANFLDEYWQGTEHSIFLG